MNVTKIVITTDGLSNIWCRKQVPSVTKHDTRAHKTSSSFSQHITLGNQVYINILRVQFDFDFQIHSDVNLISVPHALFQIKLRKV